MIGAFRLILDLFRLIVGAGLGFASSTVPLYIAEVSPESIRSDFFFSRMRGQYPRGSGRIKESLYYSIKGYL